MWSTTLLPQPRTLFSTCNTEIGHTHTLNGYYLPRLSIFKLTLFPGLHPAFAACSQNASDGSAGQEPGNRARSSLTPILIVSIFYMLKEEAGRPENNACHPLRWWRVWDSPEGGKQMPEGGTQKHLLALPPPLQRRGQG